MLLDFMRFYTITLNSFISFKKIINIEKKTYELFFFICLSFPISIIMSFLHCFLPELDYIFLIISSLILFKFMYKQNFFNTFIATTFSVGLNLCFYAVSVLLNAPFIALYGALNNFNYTHVFEIVGRITTFITHIVVLQLLFKIKRFSKGIPLFQSSENNYIGFFICICTIIVYSLMINASSSYPLMIVLIIILLLIALFLYFWWKDQTKRKLNASVINRQFIALENELNSLKNEVEVLNKLNDNLGSIIHRDNKIIPAMILAVEHLLSNYPNDAIATVYLDKLKTMSKERTGILSQHDTNDKPISKTGSIRIDSIINYMYQKAKKSNISLTLISEVDLCEVDTSIENDICTLIADATENAIIATEFAGNKDVLLQLDISNDNICIIVYDSGIPFTEKVIKNMGKHRCTTHKDTGGSGIGMMTTFEILRKYKASYTIDETISKSPYIKSITINFDGNANISYNGKLVR